MDQGVSSNNASVPASGGASRRSSARASVANGFGLFQTAQEQQQPMMEDLTAASPPLDNRLERPTELDLSSAAADQDQIVPGSQKLPPRPADYDYYWYQVRKNKPLQYLNKNRFVNK